MGETRFNSAVPSCSAFIMRVLLVSGGVFWALCSAQMVTLPKGFGDNDITALRTHFCNSCGGISTSCDTASPGSCPLCQQICQSDSVQSRRCWSDTDNTCNGNASQTFCGYQDAVVCQHVGGSHCVFKYCSDLRPYCTGSTSPQSNPDWTKNSCQGDLIMELTLDVSDNSDGIDIRSPEIAVSVPLLIIIISIVVVVITCCIWRGGIPCCKKPSITAAPKSDDTEGITTIDAEPELQAEVQEQSVPDDLEYAYAYGHTLRAPVDSEPGGPHTYTNVNSGGRTAARDPDTEKRATLKDESEEDDTDEYVEYVEPPPVADSTDDLDYEYPSGYELDPKTGGPHLKLDCNQRDTLNNRGNIDEEPEIEHEYFAHQNMPSSPGDSKRHYYKPPSPTRGGQIQHTYFEFKAQANAPVPNKQGDMYEVVELQT